MSQIFLFSLILACSGEETPNPSGKDVVITSSKKTGDEFSNKSFTCCDSKDASSLLDKYLALTRAMAADDDKKTKKAVEELSTLLKKEPYASDDALKELRSGAEYWKTLSRKDIQADFKESSQTMIDYAKSHKSEKGTTIITAYCPMADSNTGGRWLQTEKTISNPYFGSMMLTCGVFE